MFEKLGLPAFVREARQAATGTPSSARGLLRILIAYFVATLVEGMLLTPFLVVALLLDEGFWQLVGGGAEQYETAMAYTESLMSTSLTAQVGTMIATAALAATALVLCRKIEHRSYLSMGLRRYGAGRAVGGGALFALLLPVAAIVFTVALGGGQLMGVGSVQPLTLLCLLLGIFVQALSEELFFRGCLFTSLARTGKLSTAIVISSLVFAFLQRTSTAASPLAFVNLALFGALCALYMVRCGSLWGSVSLHALFLSGQALVFGSPLSGVPVSSSLLSLLLNEEQTFLHGGDFGLMGGFAMTFALCLALAILGMRKTNEE